MSMVDYEMAERTSKQVSEHLQKNEPVPNYIFRNLLIAIIRLTLDHKKLGPNTKMLYSDLKAAYEYDNADKLEGFDVGAVYGAVQFYKDFQEVRRINESRTKWLIGGNFKRIMLRMHSIYILRIKE